MISHELASGMTVLWILRHVGGTICLDYWSDILCKLLKISRNWLIHLSVSTSLTSFAKRLIYFILFFFWYCVNLTPRGRFFVMLKKLKLQGPALAPASSRSTLGGLGLTKAVSPSTIMGKRWRRRGRDRNILVRESPPKNLWLLLSFGHMSFKHIFQKCIIASGKHLFSNRKNNYRFLPLSESRAVLWNCL